jgi:uncharacterized membrane protein
MKTYLTSTSSRRRGLVHWAVAAALTLASLPAALAQSHYIVIELATPAGYDSAAPFQINDQGFVAGLCSRSTDANSMTATVWKNGTVSVLGKLKNGTYSVANAINSKGVVTGEGDDGDGRPLGWVTSGSSLVNFYSNNGGNTRPLAINDAGEIGGYYIKGFSSVWRGGIWKIDPKDARKSTLFTLPLLPGGNSTTDSSVPAAFNKTNQAAGWASSSVVGQHAVFWNNDTAHTIVDLGVFGNDWTSLAYALNDLGQVVGESHPPFSSRAILWQNNAARTATELPLLPGHNYGSAQLINNAGTIIGYSAFNEPGTWNVGLSQIVIWSGGVPYDAQSLLAPSSAGWTLNQLASINNLGQIAGLATRNGVMRPVVLTPVP